MNNFNKKKITLLLDHNLYTLIKSKADPFGESVPQLIHSAIAAMYSYALVKEPVYRTRVDPIILFKDEEWFVTLKNLRYKLKMSRKNLAKFSEGDLIEKNLLEKRLLRELNKRYQKKYRLQKKNLALKTVL